MRITDQLQTMIKATRQLGVFQVGLFAAYQLALRSGYLAWRTRSPRGRNAASGTLSLEPVLKLPQREELTSLLDEEGIGHLRQAAEEIVAGKVELFGTRALPLYLSPPQPQPHWTAYEVHPTNWLPSAMQAMAPGQPEDIKYIWEPGRFGWVFTLGRAYLIFNDERYPATFWEQFERFSAGNPPYRGPHWVSAQEVALRLFALVFADQVFAASPASTPDRSRRLAQAVADHAGRIPPSLLYARAQNNNHLLSEAAGLLTAGLALPNDRRAVGWRRLGLRWFCQGLVNQIAADGTYVQHSTNYHRLMLQLALWFDTLQSRNGKGLIEGSRQRLRNATHWLLALVDPETGQVPNLGPNDGAYIFPLAAGSWSDYRPVLQAAGEHFLGKRPFPPGPWDEMASWFPSRKVEQAGRADLVQHPALGRIGTRDGYEAGPLTIRPTTGDTWAYLRTARFRSRPGHADQLHFDLWWRGINLAMDAGTYLYNAPPPWDNSLASTHVHNTLVINGREQMRRSGRFLWLDWAQAETFASGELEVMQGTVTARHNGYRAQGVLHQREVSWQPGKWQIVDRVLPAHRTDANRKEKVEARLHWLVPDWEWSIETLVTSEYQLCIKSPLGPVRIQLRAWCGNSKDQHNADQPLESQEVALQLVRAGQLLHGVGPIEASWGWVSPTYGEKVPALSLALLIHCAQPLKLVTTWVLPE